MDEDAKALFREALDLYRRHVEAVEAYSRRYSGRTLWVGLFILLVLIPLIVPVITHLMFKFVGRP
jgi:hypothetical protein